MNDSTLDRAVLKATTEKAIIVHQRPRSAHASTRKVLLREAVEHVPEDATIEDAMERLDFLAKVARGIDAADQGDVVPHDDVEREFCPRSDACSLDEDRA